MGNLLFCKKRSHSDVKWDPDWVAFLQKEYGNEDPILSFHTPNQNPAPNLKKLNAKDLESLIKKFTDIQERYGDEYPIIIYDPAIESQDKKILKDSIEGNPSIHAFAEFEDAFKFVQSLGISFILIFSRDCNEKILIQGFLQGLNHIYDRRMFNFEEEALLKEVFQEVPDPIRKSFGSYIFVTLLDLMTEFPRTENDEEVAVMSDVKDMAKEFRQEFDVIWYDPHINPETKEKLAKKIDIEERNIYMDIKELCKRVEDPNGLQYHLIMTGKDEAAAIIKEVDDLQNLLCLYIYSDDDGGELAKVKNRKVFVKKSLEELIPKIIEGIRTKSKLKNTFPAFATHFDGFDKSDIHNLHYYLKGLINYMNREQAKEDFVKLAKNIYQSKMIFQFEQEYYDYNKDHILAWYSKESPVYKLVNNCLRIATPDSILYCRYILRDLEQAIRDHYQQERKKYNGLAYRGAYISKNEWDKLQKNVGKEIEMYGFLSTSENMKTAMKFVDFDPANKILITIIIPPLPVPELDKQGFANLSQVSQFNNEAEILFNVRSKFKILQTGTIKINNKGKECRHLVLLYGAHLLRRYMTKYQPSIEIKFRLPSEIKCSMCGSKDDLLGSHQGKTDLCCINCLASNCVPKNVPLLALDLEKKVQPSQRIVKDLRGFFLTFNQNVSNPYSFCKCCDCQGVGKEKYYKWIDLAGQEILEQCLECFEKKRKVRSNILISEGDFSIFWSEQQAEWETVDNSYQKEVSKKAGRTGLSEVYKKVENFDLCIESVKKEICQLKRKRWREREKINSFDVLGSTHEELGRHRQAQEYYIEVLQMRKVIYGEKHRDTALAYNNLGLGYSNLGEHQRALENHGKALDILKAISGEIDPSIAISYCNVGLAYYHLEEYQQALQFQKKALEIRKAIFGEKHSETAISYSNVGFAYSNLEKYQQALECYQNSLNIRKAIYGEKHSKIAILYNNIGKVYYDLKKYPQALEYYNKGLDIWKVVYGEKHSMIATSYSNIGCVYDDLGERQQGLEYYNKALDIWKGISAEQDSRVEVPQNSLPKNWGESQKAIKCYETVLEIKKAISAAKHSNSMFLIKSGDKVMKI